MSIQSQSDVNSRTKGKHLKGLRNSMWTWYLYAHLYALDNQWKGSKDSKFSLISFSFFLGTQYVCCTYVRMIYYTTYIPFMSLWDCNSIFSLSYSFSCVSLITINRKPLIWMSYIPWGIPKKIYTYIYNKNGK